VRSGKAHYDKERKILNSRLVELSRVGKAHRKLKTSFKEVVKNINRAK
jgi:hypothetical protein